MLPSLLDQKLGTETFSESFKSLYAEAMQKDPGRNDGGYIKIQFVTGEATVMEQLPSIIESLQDKGYKASDIGIIVRDKRQGALVLKTIIDYSNNCLPENRSRYNYNVISNDSLLLSGSPAVKLIISVLSYVNDPSDLVSKAAILRYYLIMRGDEDAGSGLPDIRKDLSRLPAGYEDFISTLRQKPLFESVEQIILFFGIGKYSWNTAWLNAFQDSVMSFVKNGNTDFKAFLEWWETSGHKKSVTLPGNQDAIRVLTIHKSKGLEFGVVILPFISWELDHPPLKQPLLWVKPDAEPFNELGIVPVRCSSELSGTIFSRFYDEEKHSVYLDNLNLLYVAATRAKDVLYGFAPECSRGANIRDILLEAFTSANEEDDFLNKYFDKSCGTFEYGSIPGSAERKEEQADIIIDEYRVAYASGSLKLKLHGENYFSAEESELRKKINYGKIMHEIFGGIDVPADVPGAIRKIILEGKLPDDEAEVVEKRVNSLINDPKVAPWFSAGNKVMKEAGILLPSGNMRRPDRVILRDGRTTVIDFKFGGESDRYLEQISLYRNLLSDMGYGNIEAFHLVC